jgi:predicted transcriptional regulator
MVVMAEPTSPSERVARDDVAGRRVGEVMIRGPRTLPADTSVAELREQFVNPRMRAVLLVDGERFAGVVAPDDLPATASPSEPARTYARSDVDTVRPDTDITEALAVMDGAGEKRLVVLDSSGTDVVGLLCLDNGGTHFCVGPR